MTRNVEAFWKRAADNEQGYLWILAGVRDVSCVPERMNSQP